MQKFRKAKKLKQKAVAEKLGVEVPTISRWENGKMGISDDHLLALCNLYNISDEDLLNDPSSKTSEDESSTIQASEMQKIIQKAVDEIKMRVLEEVTSKHSINSSKLQTELNKIESELSNLDQEDPKSEKKFRDLERRLLELKLKKEIVSDSLTEGELALKKLTELEAGGIKASPQIEAFKKLDIKIQNFFVNLGETFYEKFGPALALENFVHLHHIIELGLKHDGFFKRLRNEAVLNPEDLLLELGYKFQYVQQFYPLIAQPSVPKGSQSAQTAGSKKKSVRGAS